ncbi:MAG: hypothetical protein AB8A39_05505 [Prochlorococcus sp.]
MAHFAELDEDNVVVRVLVVSNHITTIDGEEVEQRGIDFLNDLLPDSGNWVQTSYNRTLRSNYAGIGKVYDPDNDVFYSPDQPYPSWSMDENYRWVPPEPPPVLDEDSLGCQWDEDTTSWVEVTE